MRILIVESTSAGQALTARRIEAIDRVDKDALDLSVGLADEQSVSNRLSSCDVLFLGSSLGDEALRIAQHAKKSLPQVEVLMLVSHEAYSGGAFRSALSTGARKVFSESAPLLDIVQELMKIHEEFRSRGKVRTSRVIAVVQAKGGIGATSTCAALAEVCAAHKQNVLLWDLDIETRDLCRGLVLEGSQPALVREFVSGDKEVSRDSLRQACMRFNDRISLLPPPDQMAESLDFVGRVDAIDVVQSMVHVSRFTHDNVIIDLGGRFGPAAAAIMRNADAVVLMLDDSLLGLSAARFLIPTLQSVIQKPESLRFLCSGTSLSQTELSQHLGNGINFGSQAWSLPVIPFDNAASRWPGSGRTLYSTGKKRTRHVFEQLAAGLQLIEPSPEINQSDSLLHRWTEESLNVQRVTPSTIGMVNPFKLLWQRVVNS